MPSALTFLHIMDKALISLQLKLYLNRSKQIRAIIFCKSIQKTPFPLLHEMSMYSTVRRGQIAPADIIKES